MSRSSVLSLELIASGKVREVYRVNSTTLLFVATDRLSAFDVVFEEPIPRKGEVLTQLSVFWFDFLKDVVPTHFITASLEKYPEQLRPYDDQLARRSMLVRSAEIIPFECVARGYLAGSGWKEYKQSQSICGVPLPAGLREGDRLPQPIFTPATKAQSGHDENISFERMSAMVGADLAGRLRDLTLRIYDDAAAYARSHGIILADTKFEFGFVGSQLTLCDEVLTPDSSRFWPLESWAPGGPQVSFDKQYVRDYLETLSWNKQPPPPHLPANVIERTTVKYLEAYQALTGRPL